MKKILVSLSMAVALLMSGGKEGSFIPQVSASDDNLFFVAQRAFEDGFYDIAIRYLNQFFLENPNSDKSTQARLLLGQCYFFKENYLKAYEVFQSIEGTKEYQDATLFWLGETYLKGGDIRQARQHYQKVLALYPKSPYAPQAQYSLAWTYYEQQNFNKALKEFLQMLRAYPSHTLTEDSLFRAGECAYHLGEYAAAEKFFQQHIERYPESRHLAQSYFYLGECRYYQKDFLRAVAYYAKAADVALEETTAVMAKANMGWSYLKLEKYDLSAKAFQEAYDRAASKGILNDEILLGMATLAAEKKDYAQALQRYEELIAQFPDSPRRFEARLGAANALYGLRRFEPAIQKYQSLIEDLQSQEAVSLDLLEKAYYGLAWTYLKSGKLDQAVATFRQIMNQTNNKIIKVSALTQMGDAYHDHGLYEKAVEIYDEILEDYPDCLYADYVQFRQGISLLKLGKREEALMSFQSLPVNFPKSQYKKIVPYYLALTHFQNEDWIQTLAYIRDYLSGPEEKLELAAEARFLAAMANKNLKRYPAAIQGFDQIMTRYSENTPIVRESRFNRAKCLYALGKRDQALRELRAMAKEYRGTDIGQAVLLTLGDIAMEEKNFYDAARYYQEFCDTYPGSDRYRKAQFDLAQAYAALNRFDQALGLLKEIPPDEDRNLYAQAQMLIAEILQQNLRPDIAVSTYQAIITNVPEFQRDALVGIARLYESQQQWDRARETYEEALRRGAGQSQIPDAELQFKIGDLFEQNKNREKALEAYMKIPYLYPDQKGWVLKAYLRSARLFEEDEKFEEARTLYMKAAAFDSEEAKYAREKIKALSALLDQPRQPSAL